ncbi:MAG: DUF493 domain-containing protein [Candidatus Omnitrophica bacterium]|nr:DUF493 domain-containing protein [Candidatus Omnitrophota bacterium]
MTENRLFPTPGELSYPCTWLYKVIGADGESVREAVAEVLTAYEYTLRFSNISSRGKYNAFNVEVRVESREQRDEIYQKLKAHPKIKVVM